MEVMLPLSRSPEFHLDGAEAAPYATAPSSPRLFGEPFDYQYHYTSAPTSPTRAAAIYSDFSSAWDNAPLSPRGGGGAVTGDMFDFAFDSGRRSEISTADELFEKGRIRPTQPPQQAADPRSGERGRGRVSPAAASGSRERETRSLSPLRNHGFFNKNAASVAPTPPAAFPKNGGGSRKWRLKDLLLFRSASEGRATERGSRDPLRKYSLFSSPSSLSSSAASSASKRKGGDQDSMSGSFRSADSSGGAVRRGGGVGASASSAHEMHYTANRAAAEELRKKTPLPYQRQGLFSYIQFNPAIRSITRGFRGGYSSSRWRS